MSSSLLSSELYGLMMNPVPIPADAYQLDKGVYSKTTYQYDVNGKQIGMTIVGQDKIQGNS